MTVESLAKCVADAIITDFIPTQWFRQRTKLSCLEIHKAETCCTYFVLIAMASLIGIESGHRVEQS